MQEALTTFTLSNGSIQALYLKREGPLMVMIHGFPGRPQDFKRVIAQLDGCSILAIALPGFGLSPSRPNLNYAQLVQSITELIAHIDPESLYLLGHSFGGALAVTVATELKCDIKGLFLLSSVGLRPHRAMRNGARYLYPIISYTPLYWLRKSIVPPLFRSAGFPAKLSFEAMWLSCQLAWEFDFKAHAQSLPRITMPCFIVHSKDDPLVETQIVHELGEQLPKAESILLDSGGHNPHYHHAETVVDLIHSKMLGR